MNIKDYMDATEFENYLESKGIIEFREKGNEISFPCPFNGCDDDHRPREEFHCSFNVEKQVYHCFKCGVKGNLYTLKKHFGDPPTTVKKVKRESLDKKAERCHKALTPELREYLHERGISDESIDRYQLGYGKFNNVEWLTIPIFDRNHKVAYFKLRCLPGREQPDKPKYKVYPSGKDLVLVGIDELVHCNNNDVLICEGELDRIVAIQNNVGMPVITSGGANIFKEEWCAHLSHMRNIYICMDNDPAGKAAMEKLKDLFEDKIPEATLYAVYLPGELGKKADLTDFFCAKEWPTEELFSEYAIQCGGAEPIDIFEQVEMGVEDIAKVLDLTIKHDFVNKVITFIAMLLAYTETDQLNIMFNSASSTGKTYICSEVSKLFPSNDVRIYGKVTPTAFYYNDALMKTDETGQQYIDLERLILIFAEQPNTQLLENLRAVLSHDNKKTPFAITNKGKGGSNKATEGYILGFSSTFFCTANFRIDEQEQTRSLILSPESNRDKLMAGVDASIERNSDRAHFEEELSLNDERRILKDRIQYIKRLHVKNIVIGDPQYLKEAFLKNQAVLQPRSQRDIAHFISLVKGMALLNARFRMVDGNIIANNKDVDEAMKLWSALDESMRYGVPPHVLDVYKSFIVPIWKSINEKEGHDRKFWRGITMADFTKEYFQMNGVVPNADMYRKAYIPILESASMISYEKDEADKRRFLIKPLVFLDEEHEENCDGDGLEF